MAMKCLRFSWGELGRGIDDQRHAVGAAYGGDRRQVDDAVGIGREADRDDRRR
jgi:hypothetical protein